MSRGDDRAASVEPAYQGRVLPRPDEEVVDQGLAFDVATLLDRRRVLRLFGAGAGVTVLGAGLAACGTSGGSDAATSGASSGASGRTTSGSSSGSSGSGGSAASESGLTEIPDETAGPYPGDGSNGVDVLSESGIVRSDLTASFGDASGVAAGIPMTLVLTLKDLANGGKPFAGQAVYVWHCNRDGAYSLYSQGVESENYLRGVQVSDRRGQVRFTSIFPACYSGRWPHIHFEVYPDVSSITDATNAIATSQVALPARVCRRAYATSGYEQSVTNLAQVSLASDGVFGDDDGVSQLASVKGSPSRGYRVALTVGVDTGTQPSGGSMGGGAPGGMPTSGGPGGTPPSGMPSGAPPAA